MVTAADDCGHCCESGLLCFILQKERFSLYKEYGECNEPAQKLLYELYEKPVFKAFFVVSTSDELCVVGQSHTFVVTS